MAGYTIRVEMHHATDAQYQRLHAAKERASYLRKILSDDGRWYALPTAESRLRRSVMIWRPGVLSCGD